MILKHIFRLVFVIKSFCVLTSGQPELNFFRSDYKRIDGTSSYYKVHTEMETWWYAKQRCIMEGAMLFYPEDSTELNAVISYVNKTNPNIGSIFIGMSSELSKGVFLSVDGVPIRDVYSQWMAGEPNDVTGEDECIVMNKLGLYKDEKCNRWLPYICKKKKSSFTEWNKECNIPYLDYKFSKELNKCYKFNPIPKYWTAAAELCESEQAYLAIPNSQQEVEYLSKITNENPKNYTGYHLSGAVHLGFRFNETLEDWYTLKGDTLDQAGYSSWDYRQPDGGERENCGSMFYNGQLNDINCSLECYFICERDNDTINKAGKN